MLSKSQAKAFFIGGTALCSLALVLLTIDTFKRIPGQTGQANLSESAIRGKHLFEKNNCMGCHTILGEGAYYAPELTKVYERRGERFIDAMLVDPERMYPGQRKMVKYDFTPQQRVDLIAFFKWIGEMDLNGFPPKPSIGQVADVSAQSNSLQAVVSRKDRPQIFNQMCVACHKLGEQGGSIGPALDGVGSRFDSVYLEKWLRDPLAVKSDSKMPKLPLSDADIAELIAFLSQLKAQ